MGTLLLALLLLILITERLMASVTRDSLPWTLSPTVWLLVPWSIATFLFSLPIFVHREALSAEHVGYIVLCLMAHVIGSNVHVFTRKKAFSAGLPTESGRRDVSHTALLMLAGLGFLGSVLSIYDNLVVTGISLSERLTGSGLNAAREMNFNSQVAQQAGPFILLEWLAGFGVIYTLCYLFMRFQQAIPQGRRRIYFLLFVATLTMSLVNSLLVSGGRMGIVMLCVVLFQVVLLDRERYLAKWFQRRTQFVRFAWVAFIASTVLIAVVLLATVFVQKRADDRSPTLQLYLSHRADLTPEVYSLTKDAPLARYGLFTLSYFTTPLPTLGLYYDLSNQRMPGPYWGQYNFPGIADRIVKRIDVTQYRVWWDARLELFHPLTRDGYGGNVWSTLLRDLAADVGWKGVPVVMFFIGWIASISVRRARGSGDPMWAAVACAFLCVTFFSVFHSVIYIQTVGSLMFSGGLVIVGRRMFGWLRPRRPQASKYSGLNIVRD